MMKNSALGLLIILFVITVSLPACSDRQSYVLSEKKMVSLMVDMELTEAYINNQTGFSSQDRLDMAQRVLKAHGVSEETLDTTLAWYGRNIDKYAKLYDKVDIEIEKRRKKYTEVPGEIEIVADNLWPYSSHVVISPLSGYDAFNYSLPVSDIKRGDIIELKFSLPNPAGMKGTLGVEYTDGTGEAIVSNFASKNKVEISIQTDSAKDVSRIFGTMHLKDTKELPLYIDSIDFEALPIDTISYRNKRRNLKRFYSLNCMTGMFCICGGSP